MPPVDKGCKDRCFQGANVKNFHHRSTFLHSVYSFTWYTLLLEYSTNLHQCVPEHFLHLNKIAFLRRVSESPALKSTLEWKHVLDLHLSNDLIWSSFTEFKRTRWNRQAGNTSKAEWNKSLLLFTESQGEKEKSQSSSKFWEFVQLYVCNKNASEHVAPTRIHTCVNTHTHTHLSALRLPPGHMDDRGTGRKGNKLWTDVWWEI